MTSFRIIIVGAGIAGLATAISLSQKTQHEIPILEASPLLTEAGAGIQCSAAASRVLTSWGLREQFEAVATRPHFTEIRRYENNELIGLISADVKNYSARLRGFPHWLVHRVDYQRILADAATTRGVKIEFGQKVVAVDVEDVMVVLEDGRPLPADLILGADGIHSKTRRSIPALKDVVPRRTENFCYRALIPREEMLKNTVTATLIDNQSQQAWAGQFKHIISYPIAKSKFYNLVMTVPDHGDVPLGKYNEPGDVSEMRQAFKDFNETVQAVLDVIDSCANPDGRVILVGDACHAMAPHAASGVATSLEDAEGLGLCVATCKGIADLPRAAKDYEHLRKPRCERIQEISRKNATAFALPDGPMQQARDQVWRAQKAMTEKQLQDDSPLVIPAEDITKQFPHPALVQWFVGHDIIEEAKTHLAS